MLEQGEEPNAAPPPPSRPQVQRPDPDDYPPEVWEEIAEAAAAAAREQLDHDYGFAAYEWEVALEQSRMAPPDPRFASLAEWRMACGRPQDDELVIPRPSRGQWTREDWAPTGAGAFGARPRSRRESQVTCARTVFAARSSRCCCGRAAA